MRDFGAVGRPASAGLAVHQVEFELDRSHRRHVELALEAGDDLLQHAARVEVVGRAVEIADRGNVLSRRFFRPGNALQAAGHRPHQHVAVTLVEDETGLRHVLARHVEDERRNRHEAAILPGGDHLVAAQDLAAGDAADIGPDDVDALDVGIGVKKGLGFGLPAGEYESHLCLRVSSSVPSRRHRVPRQAG